MKPLSASDLTTLQQTLLITLRGKALESQFADSVLEDRFAADAIEKVDFDFQQIPLTHEAIVAMAVRAKVLDVWTSQFLNQHPQANVIHLGCGLDSRLFRVDPNLETAWWEVDFPEVIQLRRQIYPSRTGCTLVGASMLEDAWLQQIPREHPTLIVAEGVLAYLHADEVQQIFRTMISHFKSGELAFDAYNTWGVWWLNQLPIMRNSKEQLHWRLDHPRLLEQSVPGLRLQEENTDGIAQQAARVGWWMRTAFLTSRWVPPLRRMGQLLRFDFG
ncbi:class I SAM-dependent methyltransferase [Bremerella cremea]|uniref:class I SAM-dependent methyltransferase n=1 Tax=Bremerella cremea TaxID=1031537 RepID=UPI0031E5CB63